MAKVLGTLIQAFPKIDLMKDDLAGFLSCALGAILISTLAALGSQAEIGFILEVHGQPTATDPTGMTKKKAMPLQSMQDKETVAFQKDDMLALCDLPLGIIFEVIGPGAIEVTPAGLTVIAGTPRIAKRGACENGAAADSNGGIILRNIGAGRE